MFTATEMSLKIRIHEKHNTLRLHKHSWVTQRFDMVSLPQSVSVSNTSLYKRDTECVRKKKQSSLCKSQEQKPTTSEPLGVNVGVVKYLENLLLNQRGSFARGGDDLKC